MSSVPFSLFSAKMQKEDQKWYFEMNSLNILERLQQKMKVKLRSEILNISKVIIPGRRLLRQRDTKVGWSTVWKMSQFRRWIRMLKNSATIIIVSVPINLSTTLGFVSVNGSRETYLVDALCNIGQIFIQGVSKKFGEWCHIWTATWRMCARMLMVIQRQGVNPHTAWNACDRQCKPTAASWT